MAARPPLQGKVSRFVALPHTEGCGASGGDSESIFSRTLIGYLAHPLVKVNYMLHYKPTHVHIVHTHRCEG